MKQSKCLVINFAAALLLLHCNPAAVSADPVMLPVNSPMPTPGSIPSYNPIAAPISTSVATKAPETSTVVPGTFVSIGTGIGPLPQPIPGAQLEYPLNELAPLTPNLQSPIWSVRENGQNSMIALIDKYLRSFPNACKAALLSENMNRIAAWLSMEAARQTDIEARRRLEAVAAYCRNIVTTYINSSRRKFIQKVAAEIQASRTVTFLQDTIANLDANFRDELSARPVETASAINKATSGLEPRDYTAYNTLLQSIVARIPELHCTALTVSATVQASQIKCEPDETELTGDLSTPNHGISAFTFGVQLDLMRGRPVISLSPEKYPTVSVAFGSLPNFSYEELDDFLWIEHIISTQECGAATASLAPLPVLNLYYPEPKSLSVSRATYESIQDKIANAFCGLSFNNSPFANGSAFIALQSRSSVAPFAPSTSQATLCALEKSDVINDEAGRGGADNEVLEVALENVLKEWFNSLGSTPGNTI